MASKSMQIADQAIVSLFPKKFIQAQFFTRTGIPSKETDLTGQVAIVTGGGSGLGYHCSLQLLSLKLAHLILAVRSTAQGDRVAREMKSKYPTATIEVWPLEMTSYTSVQVFAKRVETDLARLDIAILNAGVMKADFETCPETGHEATMQVNYFSTFLLALLLLPSCKSKAPLPTHPGRLTIVNSTTSLISKLPNRGKRPFLSSFDSEASWAVPWEAMEGYFSSKLVGQLFFVRLLDYLNGDDVIVNLVDPGLCKGSGLSREATGLAGMLNRFFVPLVGRRPEVGAWTYVDAAVTKGRESHGCFVMDFEISAFAKLVYSPEGQQIIDVLWKETMAEFEFAGVESILERSKNRKL